MPVHVPLRESVLSGPGSPRRTASLRRYQMERMEQSVA